MEKMTIELCVSFLSSVGVHTNRIRCGEDTDLGQLIEQGIVRTFVLGWFPNQPQRVRLETDLGQNWQEKLN